MIEKKKIPRRRPFGVTLLSLLVLSLTVIQWFRLYEAIRLWDWLNEHVPSPPPYYYAATGGLWGTAGLLVTIGLFLGLGWASRAAKYSGIIFTLYYWLNFLLLTNIDLVNTRWMFNAGLTIVMLILLFQILSRRSSRDFFAAR